MMPAPPYSDSSLGRLAFSQACRDLSDLARAHVATSADGHLRPGELLEEAGRLVAGAEQALRMAVVAERLRGASWGKRLLDHQLPTGVSRERAERELYERKVGAFQRMLAEGTADPEVTTQLAEARARLAELTSRATP
jgi:hypothetical protein